MPFIYRRFLDFFYSDASNVCGMEYVVYVYVYVCVCVCICVCMSVCVCSCVRFHVVFRDSPYRKDLCLKDEPTHTHTDLH